MDHDAAHFTFEPEHDKTNKMTRARSKDSGQSGHPHSLIRVTVHCMGSQWPKLPSVEQRRLWHDWVDAQADLSLRFEHRSFGCLVLRIILLLKQLRYSWLQAQNFARLNVVGCLSISLLNEFLWICLYFLKYEKTTHFEWQHYFENIILIHVIYSLSMFESVYLFSR